MSTYSGRHLDGRCHLGSGGPRSASPRRSCSSTSSSSAGGRTSPRRKEVDLRWPSTSAWRCSSASASGSSPASQYGTEFFAGWLTEYSLSVDNLFIFIIIMAKFARAAEVPAERADGRHRAGADHARHLHRRRRGGDQQLQLDLLHLRAVPALHGVQAGQGGRRGRGRVRGEPARQVGREAPARDQGVARHQDVRQGERQAGDHADVPRGPRARARPTCCSRSTRSRRSTGSPRSPTWC